MSISKRPSNGNKGSDLEYRSRVLRGLQKTADNTATLGTLSNLITTLISAVQDHQEFEIKLVRDDANDNIVLQRNEYDEETGAWSITYVDATGAPYTLVGNPEYLDASGALLGMMGTDGLAHGPSQMGMRFLGTDGTNDQQIATDANGELQVDVLSSALPTGAATESTLAALEAKLNTLGQKASAGSTPVTLSTEQETIIDAIKTAVEGVIAVSATALPLPTGAATSALQTALNALIVTIDGVLDNILVDTTAIKVATEAMNVKLTAVVRTSSLTTIIGADSTGVAAGARSVSFFNDGPNDVTIAGGTLASGISVTFSAGGEEDTLAAIPYVTIGGSKLVITTVR